MTVDHSSAFMGITIKWFNNKAISDFQVRLQNDEVIYCHRFVLSSWSDVWAAALEDGKDSSFDLTSHDATIVKMCLKYCYVPIIELDDSNLTQVHLFARQYNLKELQTTCEQMMVEDLSVSNCMDFYFYLLKHKFPDLADSMQNIKSFVYSEFVSASNFDGFLRLSIDELCQLLKENGLITTEDAVLDACCRWLAASPSRHELQVGERVMQLVRFPLLSAKKLLAFTSHPLMSQSHCLMRLHNFALQWTVATQVGKSAQEPLRLKLAEERKLENLTPRISPHLVSLQITSQLLDVEMGKALASMLGGRKVARLLLNGTSSLSPQKFYEAVNGQAPFICLIRSSTGHVFGAYVEDALFQPYFRDVDSKFPNNFLFSLKNIPPQQVVKLNSTRGTQVSSDYGLRMGHCMYYFSAICPNPCTDTDYFELAPGYESVGLKTLHGRTRNYTPEFVEVFAVAPASERRKRRASASSLSFATQQQKH